MNIDFHYGVIYLISRLAGMPQKDAQIVAHACQYVDDATTPGILEFLGGETYERFASAHALSDYNNALNSQNRIVWAPFHFLPGGQGLTLEEKSVCQPNSLIAQAMVKRAIEGKPANNSLHRLGITLHVYVDTWAHQGFSGTKSKHNMVTHLESEDHSREDWLAKLREHLVNAGENIQALALDTISLLGHGSALHFPDMPWAKWSYVNGHGTTIKRDNLPDFIEAADTACKVVQGFLNGNPHYQTEPGLKADAKEAIRNILANSRSHDEKERLINLSEKIEAGVIPGIKEAVPIYIPKGAGSWKHTATGIEAINDDGASPEWSEVFEASDYRKFHDAIKQHRFVITQEILPAHNVRLA